MNEPSSISPAEILYRLSEIARVDIGDFVQQDESGNTRIVIPHGKSWLVRRYKQRKRDGRITSITLYDKLGALAALGRIHGLFTRRMAVQPLSLPAYSLIFDDHNSTL